MRPDDRTADYSPRDRAFRHGTLGLTGPLETLVADVVSSILDWERQHQPRRRERTAKAGAALRSCVAAITANLAYFVLFPRRYAKAITLPMAHSRRAKRKVAAGFGDTLAATIRALAATQVLQLDAPTAIGRASTIRPTEAFEAEVLARGIEAPNFSWENTGPVATLSRRLHDGRNETLPFPNTGDGCNVVRVVEAVNAKLETADVAYVGLERVDTSDRKLCRRFRALPDDDESLDAGGRLYGGFWQNLRRDLRGNIRIDGKRVVELDYGQAFPRLAYSLAGEEPPEGDIYTLPGLDNCYRPGVKMAFNALLTTSRTLRQWPPAITEALPPTWGVGKLKTALLQRHPGLKGLLNIGLGLRLQRLESDALCAVLQACGRAGFTVLPIHDAVIVAEDAADRVATIMRDAAMSVSGAHLPVSTKHR